MDPVVVGSVAIHGLRDTPDGAANVGGAHVPRERGVGARWIVKLAGLVTASHVSVAV